MATPPITLLHLSDTQFGRHHRFDNDRFGNHRFGNLQSTDPDEAFDTLLSRLTDDLRDLRKDHGLQPQAVLLTGDLAECGMEDEFANMLQFATGLAEALAIPRRHFAIIAGNHDINWHLCEAYFKNCTARRKEPLKPYWEKWEFYAQFFQDFYQDEPHISFTAETPWTLFAMPELKLVVAGLNSTMAESHQEKDHYGHLGEPQLRWFQEQLQQYQQQGWFRIAALHHNLRRGPIQDDENLRDFEDFKKYLGSLVNLVVHGHTHDGKADWLSNTVPILATGSAAVKVPQRPEETPNQYQIIQLGPDYYQRWTRSYYPKDKAWGGDNRATDKLDGWHKKVNVSFADIQAVFSQNPTDIPKTPASADLPEAELQRYCAALENLHRAIPLAGFKTRLRVPIDLEALYVPLSASVDLRGTGASAFADADEACAALAAHGLAQDIKLIDAFKAAQARQRRHCVLLGDPGAGKTT
ncbi:MAG: metallophosphoesterase family protein, partial [Candidatus Methylumidiphilus sp.]